MPTPNQEPAPEERRDTGSPVHNHVQEAQEAVGRLLKYAVSEAHLEVSEDSIIKAAPLLKKPAAQFTVEDEQSLWSLYNYLSRLVTPATNESLWLKEQIEYMDRFQGRGISEASYRLTRAYQRSYSSFKYIGYFFGILFFLLQSYTYILSDSLNRIDQYYVDMAKVDDQIAAARQANPGITLCMQPLKGLREQKNQFWLKIDNHYQVLHKLGYVFWGFFYPDITSHFYTPKPAVHCPANTTAAEAKPVAPAGTVENPPPEAATPVAPKTFPEDAKTAALAETDEERFAEAERATFFEGAKSVLHICNYLLLPLVLGTLGSVAYVIRGILDRLAKASLTLGSERSGKIRIFLGSLLGLISGIVIAPDIKEVQKISYSPLVWAFMMGYSVEFAFSLFDALIERGRRAMDSMRDAATPPASSASTEGEQKPGK